MGSVKRRTALRAAALIGLAALSACSDRKADERTIVQGEKVWDGAYVTGDASVAERLLAEDFIGIKATGGRYTKAEALDDVRTGPLTTTSSTVGPITVRFYGNTAVAQGTETGTGENPARKPYSSVWTDVWVKAGGRWRIVAAQDQEPKASE